MFGIFVMFVVRRRHIILEEHNVAKSNEQCKGERKPIIHLKAASIKISNVFDTSHTFHEIPAFTSAPIIKGDTSYYCK